MKKEIVLEVVDGEDKMDILKPNGEILCTIMRDEDAFTGAMKVIQAIGFKSVWNNEKYRAARKAVAAHKPNGLTVCDNCIKTGFID